LLDAFADALRKLLNQPVDDVPATLSAPPPMLPYRGKMLGGGAMRLAAERPRKIFAMPPLFGYGAAFRNLAETLGNATLYAFDFIEDDDRLAQYVRGIVAEQPRGPLVLLGYSGGGNLAFEVAKAAEAAGHRVSDLILFDAPLKRRATERSEVELAAMTESNLEYFRARLESDADYRVFMTDPQMRALMLRKMKSFIRYLDGLVNDGAITGNIHLIRSSQDWAEAADWDLWAERTGGTLFRLQGAGIHAAMTDDAHVAANAALVDGIVANRELPL
jgi:thioesterase domain-containing protein